MNNCLSGPSELFEKFYTAKLLQALHMNHKEKNFHHKDNLDCSITITKQMV